MQQPIASRDAANRATQSLLLPTPATVPFGTPRQGMRDPPVALVAEEKDIVRRMWGPCRLEA